MHRRNLFLGCTPSPRVTARQYREEFAWWRASGWQMVVEDAADGGLWLHSTKRKSTGGLVSWGGRATTEEAAAPTLIRRFLAVTLYLHLHPIKAQRAHALTGLICTEAELAAFIRGQRRKMSKANL